MYEIRKPRTLALFSNYQLFGMADILSHQINLKKSLTFTLCCTTLNKELSSNQVNRSRNYNYSIM